MQSLAKRSILVVDDEPLLREILRDELEAAGAKVWEAGNTQEARALLRSQAFDAVLTDMRMPGGDGVALLDEIPQLTQKPVVLLMSGYPDLSLEQAIARGAKGILTKPLDLNLVISQLAQAIGG